MRNKIIFLITVFFVFSMALIAEENKKPALSDFDYSVGLTLSYNKIPILLGEKPAVGDQMERTLEINYAAAHFDASFSDYLTVGVLAGYNMNTLKTGLDFENLPLTLRMNDKSLSSFIFGLHAKSDFFTWRDFGVSANAEFLYFMNSKKNFPITLPIATGSSTLKNKSTQTTLELLIRYEGFSGFNIYAGPQVNVINGKFIASETIDTLQGSEEIKYKQKHAVGFAGGISFEAGNFDINAKVTLVTKTSASVEFSYVF